MRNLKDILLEAKSDKNPELFKQVADELQEQYKRKKFKWEDEALFIDGNFVVNPNNNDLLSSLYELCNALKSELKGYD